MKKKIVVLAIFIAVLTAGSFAFILSKSEGARNFFSKTGMVFSSYQKNDKVVARVNGKPIYLSSIALPYLATKATYPIQEAEFRKIYGSNYEKYFKKPDPYRVLNTYIESILIDTYMKNKGIKPDKEYLSKLINDQKKEFFYLINGMPKDEFNKMSETDQKIFMVISKITKDIVRQSGMTPEEFFKKKGIPEYTTWACEYSLKEQIKKNIKVTPPSEKDIENYMSHFKGVSREQAISALVNMKKEKIADEKIAEIMKSLKKNAKIEIVNKKAIDQLKTLKP